MYTERNVTYPYIVVVTLQSGLVAKDLSHPTPQNVRRGRCPLWPFRFAPVLALLQPVSPRFVAALRQVSTLPHREPDGIDITSFVGMDCAILVE